MTPGVNAVPKQTYRTPKAERERNPLKPTYTRERIRDQEQTPTKRARPQEANDYRVAGSSLRPISPKRLKALEGKSLHSTFAPAKPGTLQRKRRIGEYTITRLVSRGGRLKPGKPINREGRRAKRLKPGDRLMEALTHSERCYCGCMDYREPEKGEVARAHLESRQYESTRNEPWNNIPMCLAASHWLDHVPQGEKAKAKLLRLAKATLKRPTVEEVRQALDHHGYYTWRQTAWRI